MNNANAAKRDSIGHHCSQRVPRAPRGRRSGRWLFAAFFAALLMAIIGTASAAGTSPDAPTDLTAVADTDADPQAAIALAWTASASDGGSQITGHEYRWNAGNANWWTDWTAIPSSRPTDANATSYTVTGLLHPNPPQVYTFEVRAKNANGAGTASNQASETFDVPAKIAQLNPTIGDQSVTLEWDTPDNNGRKITHYQFAVFATRPGESTHTVTAASKLPGSDGDTTSATISGLTNGIPHIVLLGAVNAIGVGHAARQEGLIPAATPTAPTTLAAEPGDATVTLSWTAPESDGGNAITGYSFQQKQGTGDYGDWASITDSGVNTRGHTVSGLTNGTTYTFRVRAENSEGPGSASDENSATPLSVPTAPQTLTTTPGNAHVALAWTTPASNGGSPIIGYEYRYQPAADVFTSWSAVPDSNANTNGFTVVGLTNGAVHTFQVRAATADNKGKAASATATPMADPPAPPQTLAALHFNQSVKLSWLAPTSDGGSPIIRYEYRQRSGGADFGAWNAIPDSDVGQNNELAYTIRGLTNGTTYTFGLRSVNNAESSESSNQAAATPQVITTPSQPRDYAVSSGDGKILLQWLKPAQDGGRPISSYEYCLATATQCSANWITIPDSAINLHGRGYLAVASANGAYTRARLRAVNSEGGGAEDNLAAVPIAGAPAPPADLTATSISSTQIKLTWTEPQDLDGTTITSYTLEQSTDGLKWDDASQPKGANSIIKHIGEDAVAYFRTRTEFKADSPLIISGADFSRANGAWSDIATATTVGAQQASAVTVSVTDSYAHEGTNWDVVFDVFLSVSPEAGSTVNVNYRTGDHTATAGQDYTAQAGSLTFSTGERAKTISIPIIDDSHEDSGESFTLILSNPTGTIIARARAAGWIYNEETLITGFTLTDLSSNTDVQAIAADATINLDNPSDGSYTIRANPAAEAVIGTVKLELSGAQTASRTDNDQPYTLHDDAGAGLPAGNYTIDATVYPDTDAEGTPHQTISTSFTIAETEQAQTSQLSVADATASEENDATIDFVVTLNPASDETVTVDYASANGTATAGEDYTAKSGTLTFAAGDTSKTVQVSIIDDTVEDDNETFTLTLTEASGAEISDATATGTITNEEPVLMTASFSNVPENHSGSGYFTFGLSFSENVKVGYKRIRDKAFTVTGGDVTKAKRKVKGSNQSWTITVVPDGNGAVSITLPETTDCDADGAICTYDGRMLSHSTSVSVAGPG